MLKPKQRYRPRPGYVNVELTEEERDKLEALRDARRNQSGVRYSMSAVIRELIKEAKV